MAETDFARLSRADDVALPRTGRRSRLSRFGHLCGSAIAGAVIVVFGIGLGLLILQDRAVSADFLRARLVETLQREFGGSAKVEIGHVKVGGGQSYFSTQVLDLTVRSPKGEVLLSAPDARIDLSPAALARFQLSVQRLTLDRIDLAVDITRDGVVKVANFGTGAQSFGPANEVAASVLAVLNGQMGVGGDPLPVVTVEHGRLEINDERRRRKILLSDISIAAEPTDDGRPAIKVSGRTPNGSVVMHLAPGAEPMSFKLAVDRIAPGDIGVMLGDDLKFVTATLPMSLDLSARFDASGIPQSIDGALRIGRGQLFIDDPDAKPINIERARAVFSFQKAEHRIDVSEFSFETNGLSIATSGSLTPAEDDWKSWHVALSGANGTFGPMTPADKTVEVSSVRVDAIVEPEARRIHLNLLELVGPRFATALNGEAVFDEAGKMAMTLGLGFNRSDLRTAIQLWPSFVAPELQHYLVDNLASGTLDRLTVTANLSVATFDKMKAHLPIPEEVVTTEFAASDVSLRLVDGLPPLTGLTLKGRAGGRVASLTDIAATLKLPSGRTLALSEGKFTVPNLGDHQVDARAQFRAVGPTEAVMEALAQPALKGIMATSDQPDTLKGQFDGQLSIAMPLIDHPKPSDVAVEVKAALNGIVVERFFGKDRFEANQLLLNAQNGVMTLKGEGRVAGMTATVDVVQPRPRDAEDAIVTFTMDDAARQKRGIVLDPWLTGPVTVKVKSDFPVNTKAGIPIEVDLAKANIDGLLPGWKKPAGKAAKARFLLQERDGGYRVSDIDIDGAGPTVKGSAEIGSDGSVSSFKLSQLKLSPGDNIQAEGQKTAAGYRISLHGNSFDARPFLRGDGKTAHGGNAPLAQKEIELDLKAVALSGFNGEIASNGEVKIVKRGQQIRHGTIAARLNGDPISGRIVPKADGTSVLTLRTENAGAVLRFMDIYNHMQRGAMEAQVGLNNEREKGYFLVRNFTLKDEPALQRVAAVATQAASADGSTVDRPKIVGDGSEVAFERMRVDFTRTGDYFAVSEGVMWGRELGGTLSGQLDYARDRVNFSGTFVPAYGLNNALSKIPVVGFFLTGGKNEGLFAVPFRITGKASQPTLTVNPIAAVSPGFLRKILDFQGPPQALVEPEPGQ